jgi:alpha-N-arabinofuranosidase
VPLLFFNATRDTKTGTIYVKVVNRGSAAQPVRVQLSGVKTVEPKGQLVALSASAPTDTNSITEPAKLVPVTTNVDGLSADFTRSFPPYSVSVLLLRGK